jgi:hypothetical protein
MSTDVGPAVGQVFRATVSRPYTVAGVRKVHVRTTEWVVTDNDGETLTADVVGVVSESDRPPFSGYPETLIMLVSSYRRRLSTGEVEES